MSLLSSCCGNQFLLTHEPACESWDPLYLPVPFSFPHPPALLQNLSESTPNPHPMFLSSQLQDLQFLHYKGEKIHPFSSFLSCGDQKAGDLNPLSTPSKLLPSPAPPQLSKPETAYRQRELHQVPIRELEESSKLFSSSEHTHIHSFTSPSPLYLSPHSPPPLPLLLSSLSPSLHRRRC